MLLCFSQSYLVLCPRTSLAGSDGRTRLAFLIPTRGLLGYRTEFQNDTKGSGVLNHSFHSFDEYKGHIEKTEKGAIVANALGDATTYALDPLQARGTLFINPGIQMYYVCASCLACSQTCVRDDKKLVRVAEAVVSTALLC